MLMLGILCSSQSSLFSKHKKDRNGKKLGEQLYVAAQRGHIKKIKKTLKNGVDINYTDGRSETALHEAADEGHLEVVKYLVEGCVKDGSREKGADIRIRDSKGRTALWQAVDEGREDVVKYLISKGADVNIKSKKGIPLLQEAVLEKKLSVVKMLVENGADIYATNKRGKKPVYYAKKKIKAYLQGLEKKQPVPAVK